MTDAEHKSFKRAIRALSKEAGLGMKQDSPFLRGQRQAYRDAIAILDYIAENGPKDADDILSDIF